MEEAGRPELVPVPGESTRSALPKAGAPEQSKACKYCKIPRWKKAGARDFAPPLPAGASRAGRRACCVCNDVECKAARAARRTAKSIRGSGKRGLAPSRNQHGTCRRPSGLGACPPFPRCPNVAARRKGTGTVGTANPYSRIDRRRSQSPFSGSRTLCSSPARAAWFLATRVHYGIIGRSCHQTVCV